MTARSRWGPMNADLGEARPAFRLVGTAVRLLALAGVLWVARYWHSPRFGLYEDDLSNVPIGAQMSAGDWWSYESTTLLHLSGNGRPLHTGFIYLFSNLGYRLGGLWGEYWVSFAILTVNAWLFYALLRRLASKDLAFVGGLAYCLFSADTTQAYLTDSFGLQSSITFLLLALHVYLSKRRGWSYAVALLSLLTYETVFPVFLAAPLLKPGWDKSRWKQLAVHGSLTFGMLAIVTALRVFSGDKRVSTLRSGELITTPLLHMLEGPLVALGTYVYRPYQALRGLSLESGLAMLVAFVSLLMIINWRTSPEESAVSTVGVELRRFGRAVRSIAFTRQQPASSDSSISPWWISLGRSGAAMLVLAYPLTFTIRAYAITGRDTRVHLAAVIGAAILIGCLATALLRFSENVGRRRLASVVLAAFFSLLLGFSFVVQKDYVTAWQYQREFWTEILPLIPDAGEATVVLVDPTGLGDTRQIAANYWNMPRVLESIYRYPAAWELPPRVYRLAPGWQAHILADDGRVRVNAATTIAPPSNYVMVDPGNVVLLWWTGTGWARQTKPLQLAASLVTFRGLPATAPASYPPGFLYPLLIESRPAGG